MQTLLKWLSFAILAYIGLSHIIGGRIIAQEYATTITDVFFFTFLSIPGAWFLVTSYRQLFRPRPAMALISFVLYIFVGIAFLIFWANFSPSYYEMREQFSQMSDTETTELLFPVITHKEILMGAFIHLLLLLIPLYSNHARYRKENAPVTNP